MDKNIVIFFMSGMNTNAESKYYITKDRKFVTNSKQTNETGLKFIEWKLNNENKSINQVFAIVTPKAKKESWDYFTTVFQDRSFPIIPISTDDDIDMNSSFQCVNSIFDAISENSQDAANVTVHMDFTGGFRHSAMLMLALMQMLHFSGMKIGYVTYVNYFPTPGIIEEANELLNLFNLTTGTMEFKSYGFADKMLTYFHADDCSDSLKDLLSKMQRFSDNIKICSSIDNMQQSIKDLASALSIYQKFISTVPANMLQPQENFFNKLLPVIRSEYQNLISSADTPIYALHIILWCLNKELLQQAVTFYSKIFPEYILNNNILEIDSKKKDEIIKECDALGKQWKSWELGFVRKYTPKKNPSIAKEEPPAAPILLEPGYELPWTDFAAILRNNNNFPPLLKYFSNLPAKLQNLINVAVDFSRTHSEKDDVLSAIEQMPENDVLKIFLAASKPPASSISDFVKTRIKHINSTEELFFVAMRNLSKDLYYKLYNYPSNNKPATNSQQTTPKRSQILQQMIDEKTITIHVPKQELFKIIDNYNDIIIPKIRNTYNHAVGDPSSIEDVRSTLSQDIETLLKYLPK